MKRLGWLAVAAVVLTGPAWCGEVYCRYQLGDDFYYGQVEGDWIHQLSAAPWDGGTKTGHRLKEGDAKLLHPSEPAVILGISGSYREAWEGKEPYNTIRWFSKMPTSAASPGEDVEMPASISELMVETELVIVIGERVKNADIEEAKKAIFGYTVGNDIVGSAASYYQMNEEGEGPPPEDPLLSPGLKIGDGFAPYGPYIYTGIDWKNRERKLVVTDGETGSREIYRHNTSNMLFPPEKIVSDLSRVLTLNPGDIIFSGTTKALPARVGDEMEVTIEGMRGLVNRVAPARIH